LVLGRELFDAMAAGDTPQRVPFVPTVYEHAAALIGRTPSETAQNEDLLVEAQLRAYELYGHDLVAVGLDIYNVEAEALGTPVNYYGDSRLPSLAGPLLPELQDLDRLRVPNPETAGRMPLYLRAAERVKRSIGGEVLVNGTVVGPFTLAALLRGFEKFILDILNDGAYAGALLDFCRRTALRYARSFLRRGVGVSINESWIAPPLLSPALYEEKVQPVHQCLVAGLKDAGQEHTALICGGNTTAIAEPMLRTGTALLMADSTVDHSYFCRLCAEYDVMLRASIDSGLLCRGNYAQLCGAAQGIIQACGHYPKFIFGCGIVPFEAPPERVLALKEFVRNAKRPGNPH